MARQPTSTTTTCTAARRSSGREPRRRYTDDQPSPPATSGNLSYTVKAVDALGNASTASVARTVVYDIAAPSAVASLTAASPTIHPALGWTTASDAGGSGLAGYRVYRDGVQVTQTTGTTFIDSSLSGDGTYAYTVRAIDNAGNLGAALPHPHGPGRPDTAAGSERPRRAEPDEPRDALLARHVRHRRLGQRRRPVPRLPQREPDRDRLGDRVHRYLARDRGHVAVHRLGDRCDRQRGPAERADLGPVRRHSATGARRARRRGDLDDASRRSPGSRAARTRSRASTTTSCCATARSSPRPRRRASST